MHTLTIHHPDSQDDPYPIHDLGESGPASLGEAIKAEAEIVAAEIVAADCVRPVTIGGQTFDGPGAEIERAVFTHAYRQLLASGAYSDPMGVRWTLTLRTDVAQAQEH